MKEIILGKRAWKNKGKFVLVDDEDFERLSRFNWYAYTTDSMPGYYAARIINISKNKRKIVFMQNELIDYNSKYEKVYHRNGNSLDNRKSNLIARNKDR